MRKRSFIVKCKGKDVVEKVTAAAIKAGLTIELYSIGLMYHYLKEIK